MTKKLIVLWIAAVTFTLLTGPLSALPGQQDLDETIYLPVIFGPSPISCPTSSNNSYVSGPAFRFDTDNPVRPAYNHADKNIELRGYAPNTDPNLKRELVDYGSDDPTQPPQLATLFRPNRVPAFGQFLQVHHWSWAPSPNPGTRSGPITMPATTAVRFTLPPGQPLHVPTSGYDIGGGAEVLILFADADTVTLHYTREDSAARGYTIHIDEICTDPNLLNLYNSLDAPGGPRYSSASYHLPALPAGQVFGTTSNRHMVVAIADTGAFQDPRSCNEWWQIRPGYTGQCPPPWQTSNLPQP
jgi:hypothetical protein